MHIENEPARILRNRSLDQVFGPAKENGVFRFRPTEDVIVAHLTEPRSLGGVPLPSVCAYRDAEVAVYAVVVDAPNDLNVHLLRGAPRAQPETVWSRDFGSRRLGAIALSPRGTYLVLCLRAPGEVLLIDTHEGKLLWSKRLGGPECVAISPDETWAAIGNSSEIVFRFALPGDGSSIPLQREQAGPLDGLVTRSHESTVRGLAFSADGRTLASCSSRITNTPVENELRFWDIATGADLGQWFRTKLPRAPEWLAVSPSGRRLAIGGRAGWVEIRRFSPAER
jgi:WD40 repeat protein